MSSCQPLSKWYRFWKESIKQFNLMEKGKINVSVDNIFPLIKKFLYSDQEIFLRELISNATDATLKLKHLSSIGEAKVEYGSPIIEVKVDKENKTLRIIDQGIGMSEEEIKKYINEVAFSGAEEFLDKYKDSAKIRVSSGILVWDSILPSWLLTRSKSLLRVIPVPRQCIGRATDLLSLA